MASLREWTALTLSALLFSVVAGYGVGRALNARNDGPAPRPSVPSIAIVDRTGEPASEVGELSSAEMAMPAAVAQPEPPPSAPAPAPAPTVVAAAPAPVVVPPAPAAAPAAAPAPVATPVAATAAAPFGEKASLLVSFTDHRLYVMSGDRQLASYRVKFGFDTARVKPGETRVHAKSAGKALELGWKSFPITAGGDRGFILSHEDFEALAHRIAIGAIVATTRDRVSGAATGVKANPSTGSGSSARVTPVMAPVQIPIEPPAPQSEIPAIDAEQPAFLAAAPKSR